MSNGTTIPVYVKHLHKSNAASELDEAQDMIKYYTNKLIAMAASSGETIDEVPWHEHVAREVPEMLEEYGGYVFKAAMARRIIDDPDECHDELEALSEG